MGAVALGDSLVAPYDMARFAIAYGALVLAPGYALAALLSPRAGADRLQRVALAVPCACALIAVFGLATALLRLPFAPPTYALVALPVVALGIIAARRRDMADSAARKRDRWWLAAVGVAVAEGTLCTLIHAGDVVPAAVDVLSHVVWTQQIAQDQLFPMALLSSHPGSGSGGFYPPVFHALTALVAEVSGVPVYRAVFYSALTAVIVLPLGLFCLVREMTGSPRLAGLAVLASLAFEPAPLWVLAQGLYPFLLSFLLIPALVLALADGVGRGERRSVVLAAGLGVGLFYTHPTEFLTVALLALPMAPILAGGACAWARRASYVAVLAAAWGGAAVPVLAAVRRTMVDGARVEIGARHDFVASPQLGPGSVLRSVLHSYLYAIFERNVSYALCALAAAGVVWCLARRRFRGLVVAQIILVAVFMDASSLNLLRPLYVLSFPWALGERLAPTHYWTILPLAALGLDALLRTWQRLHWSRDRIMAVLVATPCAVLGIFMPLDVAARHAVAYSDARRTVAPADVGAMRWLARHAGQAVVVDDEDMAHPELFDVPIDAGRWMPVFGVARPLFGAGGRGPGTLGDRIYLLRHIADVPLPRRAARLVAAFQVRYVFYGAATPPLSRRHLNLRQLLSDPRLHLAYTSAAMCHPGRNAGPTACPPVASYVFTITSAAAP